MKTLGWMQKRFRKNYEQSTNVSTRKSYSCFLWRSDEQLHHEANNDSARFKQPGAVLEHGAEIVNEKQIGEMTPEFFHGFLAIGTLGSVVIPEDTITPKAAIDEEESSAAENEMELLNTELNNVAEKETEDEENTDMVLCPLKEYYEMPAIKEEKEQKTTPVDNISKMNVASHKRSGESNKLVKKEIHAVRFMKKMVKKLDFTLRCNTASAFNSNEGVCDSTKKTTAKIPTKGFRKSTKVHPEAATVHVNKSHNYEVKKMCCDERYDKDATSDDEEKMYQEGGMFKKETSSGNMFAPAGKKEHWIKTDADYFVLEF